MNEQEPTSVQPGMVGARRYPRTFNGLVASMLILVVAVVSCSVLQNANQRTVSTQGCGAIDTWHGVLADAQAAGVALDYPGSLPQGWKVTSATWDNDDRNQPRWRISIHSADCTQFAALLEQPLPGRTLLQQVGQGEVSRVLTRPNDWNVLVRANNQAVLDAFIASLTTAKLPKN